MKVLHRKRLEKLAAHLEKGKLGHKKFNFRDWNADEDGRQLTTNGCGYSGCAIGECPFVFPHQWTFVDGFPELIHGDNWSPAGAGIQFFGLRDSEFDHLFRAGYQQPLHYGGSWLGFDATPKQVAANIREFLKRKTGDTTNE